MDVGKRSLVRSLRGAANVANATRPFARSGYGSIPSFFSGWWTSELPLHTAVARTVRSVGHVRNGSLRSPYGWAALAVDALSSAQLVRLHRAALQAPKYFEAALADELGSSWRTRIAPEFNVVPTPLTPARVAQPFATRRRAWCVANKTSYGDAGKRNHLEIWRGPNTPSDGSAPVLLQVHGGAWIIGHKSQQAQPLMEHMTDRGWICVSINYSLSPKAAWPAHIVDVKRAIAWVKQHIGEYGGDPNFLAITGGSAGGHLSSLAALTANDPQFQPGFEAADTTVQCAVPMYGVYDFINSDGTGRADMIDYLQDYVMKSKLASNASIWEAASPMARVHADAPPFMLVHGTNDALVPIEQARSFADVLRKTSSQPVVFVELPGTQHAFDTFWSPRTHAAVHAIESFVNVARSAYVATLA